MQQGVPVFFPSKFVPLSPLQMDSGITPPAQHWGLSVKSKGVVGEEGRRGMGSGSRGHSFRIPESKWHRLLL